MWLIGSGTGSGTGTVTGLCYAMLCYAMLYYTIDLISAKLILYICT